MQIQIYNTGGNSWRTITIPANPNTGDRYGGSMNVALIAGIVYFCGGITNENTIASCGSYAMARGVFGAVPSMPVPVNHATYASDGSRMYVVGGRSVSPSPVLVYI